MINKRVLLLCGHYGSGKTNIAVNLAFRLKEKYPTVTIADLDIVNPYFRSKDSAKELEAAGIRLICSNYANSNVDIPALPPDLYALTDDRRMRAVIDVGGDDRGALVLGRIAPALLEENDYEMLMVINCYRPLTRDAASTVEVMREIEVAGGIRFTGLVNNSNLGVETTPEDVLTSVPYANEVSTLCGLPLVMTTAEKEIAAKLEGKISNLLPLDLQKKIQ
jgi:hypothetical protein